MGKLLEADQNEARGDEAEGGEGETQAGETGVTNADIFGGAISIVATAFVVQSLYQGCISMHWLDLGIHKADNPGTFWFVVSLYAFVAVIGVLFILLG